MFSLTLHRTVYAYESYPDCPICKQDVVADITKNCSYSHEDFI